MIKHKISEHSYIQGQKKWVRGNRKYRYKPASKHDIPRFTSTYDSPRVTQENLQQPLKSS
jgi:hypothetical protein